MKIQQLTQTPLHTFEIEELTDYTAYVYGTIISIDGKEPLIAGEVFGDSYFYVDRDGTLNYTPDGYLQELIEDNLYNHNNDYLYEFFAELERHLAYSLSSVDLKLDDKLDWNGNIRCLPDGDILDAATARKITNTET